ncbi:MAG: hypothetical protein A2W19_05480 [Spirochaetes bacterium RBG_16_49_21]|nr:MAG: hypothetical protein A2W19_05480 [Spirochaetes bacterium RBG_16_49_21]
MERDTIMYNLFRILFFIYLVILGFSSLLMIMGYDQLNFHYISFQMTEWGKLPYRDVYDIQYYGIYLYHFLIQKLFGYSDLGFRIFDLLNFIFACLSLYFFLRKLVDYIDPTRIYLILILFTASYYGLGWWWTGQREIFQLPYVLWSFYFYKKASDDGKWYNPLISGLLSGFAFFIKPFVGLYLPLFVIIHFIFNYPYPNPFQRRIKIAVLSGIGFLIMVVSFTLYLQLQGILSSFLNDSLKLAVEFKKIGFPFLTNLYFAIFRFDFDINIFYILIYKIFYAIPIIISIIYILIKFFLKEIRPNFPIIFLFLISLLLIIIQKNGNVVNHHIPLVCFKSIITVLFFYDCFELIINFLLKKGHINASMKNVLLKGILLNTVIFLSVPSFLFGFDEYTRKYITGKISLRQLQSIKYPLQEEEDMIVQYINNRSHIDRNKDEILNFNFSLYIPYHSRVKTFSKFINNGFFYMIPDDSEFYKRLVTEFLHGINKKNPAIIIAHKNDAAWAKKTCFNKWTTSYNELLKLGNMKNLIQLRYKKAIETESLVVFQLIK